MSTLTDLITKVADYDPDLSDALKTEFRIYAQRRPFGLNFERHQPENVRLYGRPAHVGDLVNILPPRGTQEGPDNRRVWRITAITDGRAELLGTGTEEDETTTADVVDLVTLSEFDKPIYPGLKETGRVERGGDKPYQVVINAENYHALKALLYPYKGKVDCIYIDPPYNTRDNDWKYNNDYVNKDDAYQHSKWLAMMERRLKLAKQLLNPESSVLIVTIDEKEYLRLGMLLEQTFLENRIQMVSALTNRKGQARNGTFARCDEYIFFVFCGLCSVKKGYETMLGDDSAETDSRGNPWNSLLRRGTHSARWERPNLFFPVFVDEQKNRIVSVGEAPTPDADRESVESPEDCVAVWPMHTDGSEGCWQLSVDTFRAYLERGYIKLGRKSKTGQWAVNYLKRKQLSQLRDGELISEGRDDGGSLILRYADADQRRLVEPRTMWLKQSFDASVYGTTLLRSILPGRTFPFPKSLYAVEDTIRFFVADKPNALILDFFAGSGTTAHAVMRLNHQDGGHRRCILVTNNEVSADEEKTLSEQGYRHGDPEWERLGICEYVTKPRVTAAITGRTPEGEPIKGDYKFTDEFPMAEGFEENAIFYELTYQNEASVELDQAFEAIAPLLWMKAGSRGRCITERKPDFDIADTYAILFDYRHVRRFLEELENHEGIRLACIVTDQESRFRDVAGRLPEGIEPLRLYESYLRSFRFMQGEE
ncbi:site-specific DNA-methyltransferase [uncultured Bifidobacterium sp.]|uniref:site-specific DNA-methyltransferase n=1 Tax=uncultured Bifidobacterium sp. TaxID=165187 RepID=UPI00258A37ED|nr:DNA methyltransferase [uncultured Bifidobacterium sp.]